MFNIRFFDWLRGRQTADVALPPPVPEQPLAVIGDIHGRADLLGSLLDRIPADYQVVCVGDYIDRGDQSAAVICRLQERADIMCLKGNHEDMMLKFLEDPEKAGDRWLRYGGLQTLHSFGVQIDHTQPTALRLLAARDQLGKALGDKGRLWLDQLETHLISGNVAVVHAAADPDVPIPEQTPSVLLWGHPEFPNRTRQDGTWVVHGHTIVEQAQQVQGRIAVDTGAYATGRLTAALISDGEVRFIAA